MDDWENVILFHHYQSGTLTFSELFAQHVDHRLLVVRVIFLGLYSLFGEWNLVVEMLASALLLGAIAGTLVYLARGVNASLAAVLLSCVLLTSPMQWENILMGFQIQFYVLVLMNVLIVSLIAITDRPSGWLLALLAVLCVVSSFAMGSGMFSWGIAGACLVVRHCLTGKPSDLQPNHPLRVLPLLLFVAAAILCATAYLHGYDETNPDLKPKSVGVFLQWLVRALNYPLLETVSPFRVVLAAGQWIVIGTAIVRHFRQRQHTEARAKLTLMIGFAGFLFLNAAITGYRRSGVLVQHPEMEIVSRYATIFLWSTILFLLAAGELFRDRTLTQSWRGWLACSGLLFLIFGTIAIHAGRYTNDLTTMSHVREERLAQCTTVINYLRDSPLDRKVGGPAPIFENRLIEFLGDSSSVAQLPPWLQAAGSDLPVTTSGNAWSLAGVPPATLPEERRVVWGSWSGVNPNTGQLQSANFKISKPILVIPLCGFPTAVGNRFAIVTQSASPITLVYAGRAPGEKWQEWRADVSGLIGQQARIVATHGSTVPDGWFGFAVPWQTSRLMNYLERLLPAADSDARQEFEFEVTASSPEPQTMQLFYLKDGQAEYSESSSVSTALNSKTPRMHRFPLSPGSYTAFRFDPMARAGQVTIQNAVIRETKTGTLRYALPVNTWIAAHDLDSSTVSGDTLSLTAQAGHADPSLSIPLPQEKLILLSSRTPKLLSRLSVCAVFLALAGCIYSLIKPSGIFDGLARIFRPSIPTNRESSPQ